MYTLLILAYVALVAVIGCVYFTLFDKKIEK